MFEFGDILNPLIEQSQDISHTLFKRAKVPRLAALLLF